MSVVVEFSLPPDDFALGSALAPGADVEVALEAVVPVGGDRVPLVWVTGGDLEAFEPAARAAEPVSDLRLLERFEDDALYRLEWSPPADGVLSALAEHGAAVLEATRLRRWRFQVRFHAHDHLREFHAFCRANDVDVSVTRVAVLDDASGAGPRFDLTPEQREALLLAVRGGYFEVPRRTDLSTIADELGISRQTTSNRVRRGVDRVLQSTLLGHGSRNRS